MISLKFKIRSITRCILKSEHFTKINKMSTFSILVSLMEDSNGTKNGLIKSSSRLDSEFSANF